MSAGCAALPTDWARFDSEWHVDFEYRQDANQLPLPISMHAHEDRSGVEIFLRREELLELRQAPFGTGARDVMVAYAANAELSCFLQLGWRLPCHVLDLYVEAIVHINGRLDLGLDEGRPGLVAALELFGLPSIAATDKKRMRELILNNESYTAEQWEQIKAYNRSDTEATRALLAILRPRLDLPRALFLGRYMAAVARMERIGLPIDTGYLTRLVAAWEPLQRHFITRDDEFGLYDGTSFRELRMVELIRSKKWDWPLTPTGKPELKIKVLGRQAKRYTELKRLVRLRDTIAELRISKLVNTVGADGFSRCSLLPFWTITGRNQPSARAKVFLPSLPAWLHGLLRPPPGLALIELDWDAQEIGIVAGLSGDAGMIADYRAGDPHWAFGVRAGLVPPDADKLAHLEDRNKKFKPVTLGVNYGMTPYGIAAKTGRSLLWARDIYARHRQSYPVFHRWIGDVVAQAKFDGSIASPFGWPLAVIAATKHRTLLNFPAQAGGADAMRIASIAATEAGISVCAPVHDAFWILAPIEDAERTIERMREIMVQAATAVSGGLPITASIAARIFAPCNLGQIRAPGDRGAPMWSEVAALLAGGLRRQTGS